MKTIVVAINNHKFASQFTMNNTNFIMKHEDEHIRVILHNSLLLRQNFTDVEINADIVIDTNHNTFQKNEILYHMQDCQNRLYVNQLLQKDTQRYLLNRILLSPEMLKYNTRPIRYWSFDKSMTNGHSAQFGTDFTGVLVLKTKDGARGVGQVLFDTNDYNPLYIIKTLTEINKEISETKTTLQLIKEALPKISFGGKESDVLESLDHLTKPENLYLEEHVSGINEEYRVLVSPNNVKIYPRKLEDRDGYQQAIGSSGGMKENQPVSEELYDFVRSFLYSSGIEYGSIDIFIGNHGEMGILEFSGQFAADGVSTQESSMIQQDLIETIVGRHLRGESLNVRKTKE